MERDVTAITCETPPPLGSESLKQQMKMRQRGATSQKSKGGRASGGGATTKAGAGARGRLTGARKPPPSHINTPLNNKPGTSRSPTLKARTPQAIQPHTAGETFDLGKRKDPTFSPINKIMEPSEGNPTVEGEVNWANFQTRALDYETIKREIA